MPSVPASWVNLGNGDYAVDNFDDAQFFYISDDATFSGLDGITAEVVGASVVNGHVSYDLADAAIVVGSDTAMGGQVYTSGGDFEHIQAVSLSEDPGGKAVSISAPTGVYIAVAVVHIKSHGCVRLFIDGGDRTLDAELANIPLPLFAYVEGEDIIPIGIVDGKAGWGLFPGLSQVRIAGYNLPTNLKYNDDMAAEHDLTADGGDYGIEFTQPNIATFVTVFDAGFWLFFDRR